MNGYKILSMFPAQFCTTFFCFCIAFFICIICLSTWDSMDLVISSERLLGQEKVVADVYDISVEAKT